MNRTIPNPPTDLDQPLAQTSELNITTLLGVGIDIICTPDGQQTLVIQKMQAGQRTDQIQIPMDPIYAAGVRTRWDTNLANTRNGANDLEPEGDA